MNTKKVLIPTDFTSDSLVFVKKVAKALPADKLNIVLFHAFVMPTNIMDLMFIQRDRFYSNLINDSFRKECKEIKEQYPYNVQCISFRHIIGDSKALFKNFLEANEIDLLFCPHSELKKAYANSANMLRLLRSAKKPLLEDVAEPLQAEKILIRQLVKETVYA